MAGILGAAALTFLFAFASLIALAGIAGALILGVSAALASRVRGLFGSRQARPPMVSRCHGRIVLTPGEEVRRIEMEVLDPVSEPARRQ